MDSPPTCTCHGLPMWWRKDRQRWTCLVAKHDQSHLPSSETVTCAICGAVRRTLRGHIGPLHGLTPSQYQQLYGEDPIGENLRGYMRDNHLDHFGGVRWTQERILAAIRQFAKANGRPPKAKEWQRAGRALTKAHETRRSYPSCLTVVSAFGTWNAAIEAAGLAPRGVGGAGHDHRTHCRKGHNDWYVRAGRRWCRPCYLNRHRQWRANRKAA